MLRISTILLLYLFISSKFELRHSRPTDTKAQIIDIGSSTRTLSNSNGECSVGFLESSTLPSFGRKEHHLIRCWDSIPALKEFWYHIFIGLQVVCRQYMLLPLCQLCISGIEAVFKSHVIVKAYDAGADIFHASDWLSFHRPKKFSADA